MVFGRDTLKELQGTGHDLSHAVYQHADAVQHLAESLEEEVSSYTQELALRISTLRDSAIRLSDAGLEIADAGARLAMGVEHVALGLQQVVYVVAASMLTFVAGMFGWRYLLLGCALLYLSGFELHRRQPQVQSQKQWQQHFGSSAANMRPCTQPDSAGGKRVSFEAQPDDTDGFDESAGTETVDVGIPSTFSGNGDGGGPFGAHEVATQMADGGCNPLAPADHAAAAAMVPPTDDVVAVHERRAAATQTMGLEDAVGHGDYGNSGTIDGVFVSHGVLDAAGRSSGDTTTAFSGARVSTVCRDSDMAMQEAARVLSEHIHSSAGQRQQRIL